MSTLEVTNIQQRSGATANVEVRHSSSNKILSANTTYTVMNNKVGVQGPDDGEPSNKDTTTPIFNVSGSGVNGVAQITRHTSVGGGGAILHLAATRGTSNKSYTILQDDDGIGQIGFLAADGNEFVQAAGIKANVDGTPGDNDMPTRLSFSVTADGASTPTERMRIHNSGVVSFNDGIELGSALDATAANVLDDYEEGSWTPICGTASVSGTYSVQLGRYIKVGHLVHVIFNLTISAGYTGSTSNSFTIGGLPFATKYYDGSLYAGGHIGYYFNLNHTDNNNTIVYQIPSGSSLTMELKGVGDNIGEQIVTPAMMGTTAVIRGSITYHAA